MVSGPGLSIPARLDLLHCAGNDAHYTLQAFLALLQSRYPDNTHRLENLARQELRSLPSRNAKTKRTTGQIISSSTEVSSLSR
jgi:hypothetical protein